MRYNDLLTDIETQKTDKHGVKGKWIKATKHSDLYDEINPNHIDAKGWKWWREIEDNYESGKIVIYKQSNGHNWFSLPEYEEEFRIEHPDKRRKRN